MRDKRRRSWVGLDADFYTSALAQDLYAGFGVAGVALYDAAIRACATSILPGHIIGQPAGLAGSVGLSELDVDVPAWLAFLSRRKLICKVAWHDLPALRFNKWNEGTRALAQRDALPPSVRKAVFDRDENRCQECGTTERLSIDHIWPYSLGGSDEPSNLRTLCVSCNSSKGARV